MSKERDEAASDYDNLLKKLDAIQEERQLEGRYTEALVSQRDNMNAIIKNSQEEIKESSDLSDLTPSSYLCDGKGEGLFL